MDEKGFEQSLQELLKQDLSKGTEAFRDELLARCLNELESGYQAKLLDDDELDMLAAAGDAAFGRSLLNDDDTVL